MTDMSSVDVAVDMRDLSAPIEVHGHVTIRSGSLPEASELFVVWVDPTQSPDFQWVQRVGEGIDAEGFQVSVPPPPDEVIIEGVIGVGYLAVFPAGTFAPTDTPSGGRIAVEIAAATERYAVIYRTEAPRLEDHPQWVDRFEPGMSCAIGDDPIPGETAERFALSACDFEMVVVERSNELNWVRW